MFLKRGDSNEDVRKIQLKLGLDPVGIFGPKTEEAVKSFQSKHNLNVDGIVTQTVWNLIMSIPTKTVDYSKLKGGIPDKVFNELDVVVGIFQINTPLRLSHFLAQCAHESMEFKLTIENLNYSADGLLRIFPKYFTQLSALKYQRSPERIANIVYSNRMGNGDINSGEGWKYRGRGYIQLTGKDNYTAFNNYVSDDVIEHPDLVATKYPLLSAAWFFHKNGINKISDRGNSTDVITQVTRKVNGGTIGLKDRIHHFEKYYKILV